MIARRRATGRRCLAFVYRVAFYAVAAAPVWGAAATVVVICRHGHLS
jgi:hypothetical protein